MMHTVDQILQPVLIRRLVESVEDDTFEGLYFAIGYVGWVETCLCVMGCRAMGRMNKDTENRWDRPPSPG